MLIFHLLLAVNKIFLLISPHTNWSGFWVDKVTNISTLNHNRISSSFPHSLSQVQQQHRHLLSLQQRRLLPWRPSSASVCPFDRTRGSSAKIASSPYPSSASSQRTGLQTRCPPPKLCSRSNFRWPCCPLILWLQPLSQSPYSSPMAPWWTRLWLLLKVRLLFPLALLCPFLLICPFHYRWPLQQDWRLLLPKIKNTDRLGDFPNKINCWSI